MGRIRRQDTEDILYCRHCYSLMRFCGTERNSPATSVSYYACSNPECYGVDRVVRTDTQRRRVSEEADPTFPPDPLASPL